MRLCVNKTKIKIFLGSLRRFSTSKNDSEGVNYVKVNDLKKFSKKFDEDEVKKYLDPYGFLNTNEYKDQKNNLNKEENATINTTSSETQENEKATLKPILRKLEEIEKIEDPQKKAEEKKKAMPKEYGYKYNGPEPTRYGDWDVKGKCVDF